MNPKFDDRDQAILDERIAKYDSITDPRVGDFVVFADGVTRRISYLWGDSVQTSDGGGYYLGAGYISMSGGLHPGVPPETLTLTDEKKDGSVWFFHHDWWTADNGVYTTMPFRVYTCSREAN